MLTEPRAARRSTPERRRTHQTSMPTRATPRPTPRPTPRASPRPPPRRAQAPPRRPAPHAGNRPGPEWHRPAPPAPAPKINHRWPGVNTSEAKPAPPAPDPWTAPPVSEEQFPDPLPRRTYDSREAEDWKDGEWGPQRISREAEDWKDGEWGPQRDWEGPIDHTWPGIRVAHEVG